MSKYLLVIYGVLLSISSCFSELPKNIEITSFLAVEDIELSQIFAQNSLHYLLYFYSDTCGHCLRIKDTILDFYYSYKGNMYFVNADKGVAIGKDRSALIGVNNLDNFYILGTPSLFTIDYHKITNYYLGEQEILEYIKTAK